METQLKSLTFSLYRLSFEPTDEVVLARSNKGITLRGAFGTAFRRLVCHDLGADCDKCVLHPSCPYGFIFAPTVPAEAERLRLNRDIPRPFVIKPPLNDREVYEPGDLLCFDLVVVGKAQDFLPYFIVTFEELGRQGIGVRRGRFQMLRLESLNGDGSWHEIFHRKDRMVTPPASSLGPKDLFRPGDDRVTGLTMRFLTPVLLKQADRWAKPGFGTLVRRLRDRVNALSSFYCGKPLEMDFKELGEEADKISIIRESLRWTEEKRFSKHRDLQHVLKGFIGEVEFRGDITPFMPLLRLGEVLHVGKATAFGQGWFKIN
jgi:hypothetical protein